MKAGGVGPYLASAPLRPAVCPAAPREPVPFSAIACRRSRRRASIRATAFLMWVWRNPPAPDDAVDPAAALDLGRHDEAGLTLDDADGDERARRMGSQPVTAWICAIVAPSGRRSSAVTLANAVPLPAAPATCDSPAGAGSAPSANLCRDVPSSRWPWSRWPALPRDPRRPALAF